MILHIRKMSMCCFWLLSFLKISVRLENGSSMTPQGSLCQFPPCVPESKNIWKIFSIAVLISTKERNRNYFGLLCFNEATNNMEIDAGHPDVLVMPPCCDFFFLFPKEHSTENNIISEWKIYQFVYRWLNDDSWIYQPLHADCQKAYILSNIWKGKGQ